jgi:Concanavalin A-like lectin/glucanases superfamily
MVRFRRLGLPLPAVLTACALVAPAAASASSSPLSGWWPMNEGTGQTVRDWSGNGNNGTLGSTAGADDNDPSWIPGVFWGSALRFDGNDFVRIPSSSDLQSQNLTVSAWVRGSSSPGRFDYVVAKGASGDCVASSYGLYTGSNGGMVFYTYDGTGETHGFHLSPAADPTTVWDGRWHNVAGTYDGQTVRLFIDGNQVGTGTPATAPVSYAMPSGDGLLGSYVDSSCSLYLVGDIDGVSIWNRALPVSELAPIFRGLLAGR